MNKKVIILIILFIVIFAIIFFLFIYPSLNKELKPETGSSALVTAIINPAEIDLQMDSFSEGWPEDREGDTIVSYYAFTLNYDEEEEQASWVAYILTAEDVKAGGEERTDNFRPDPNIHSGSASLADYKSSGYDRGHLAPAGDMTWSPIAMSESFYMTNMSPQRPSFNRGIWKKLEEQVRDWAVAYDSIYVISGPVLTDIETHIGQNEVGVPAYYFKVILDLTPPNKLIAFLLPNASSKASIYNYALTVDSLEAFTGYDFFPKIKDQRTVGWLESHTDTILWLNSD